ncbi:MAG: Alg9 family protein mannosyltransferase [Devosia sp.]|nr:Alg9 family protein mannosyltransferase [Devosia sp.]
MFIGNRLRRMLAGGTGSDPKSAPYSRNEQVILAAIFVVALAIRVAAAVWYPSVHHPDETFQYWEQGHRLAFGFGIVPWEYRMGIRSYFIPSILAGVMKVVAAFGGGPGAWTPAVQVLLSAISLSIVATAFEWGRRAGGTSAAVLAAVLATTWFEVVYFAAKPLTESIATSLLFPAAYMLCLRHSSRMLLVWGGLLLGLAFVVRFQLAPAVLVITLWCILVHGWRCSILAVIATPAVILTGGLLDWVTLGSPFQSVWLNFLVNAVEGKASNYGVQPAQWFLLHFSALWAGVGVVMLLLAFVGLTRAPVLLVIAVVIVLAHSAIGHKEYRFVFPAVPFLLTLAAIGTARLFDLAAATYSPGRRIAGLAFIALCFVATSINLANQPAFKGNWVKGSNGLAAFGIAAGIKATCGIGLASWSWVDTPGYRALGRDVPIYPLISEEHARELEPAFNVVVTRGDRWKSLEDRYEEVACSGDICVALRSGTCSSMPAQTVNPYLVRKGE